MAETQVRKKMAKGKIWFKIHAPKIFNEKEIGETVSFDQSSIIGRKISLPLSEITGDITKHYIKVDLRINEVKEGHAYTEIVGYSISRQYLTKLIRRRTSKVEVINDIKFKEDKIFRVKTVVITAHPANEKQKSAIHNVVKSDMERIATQYDLPNFISALSAGKIQQEIIKNAKKIFPIKVIEVRKIETLPTKKEKKKREEATPAETEAQPVKEEQEAEEEPTEKA